MAGGLTKGKGLTDRTTCFFCLVLFFAHKATNWGLLSYTCVRISHWASHSCYEQVRTQLERSLGRIRQSQNRRNIWIKGKLSTSLSCLPEAAPGVPKTHVASSVLSPQTGAKIYSKLRDQFVQTPWDVAKRPWTFRI